MCIYIRIFCPVGFFGLFASQDRHAPLQRASLAVEVWQHDIWWWYDYECLCLLYESYILFMYIYIYIYLFFIYIFSTYLCQKLRKTCGKHLHPKVWLLKQISRARLFVAFRSYAKSAKSAKCHGFLSSQRKFNAYASRRIPRGEMAQPAGSALETGVKPYTSQAHCSFARVK